MKEIPPPRKWRRTCRHCGDAIFYRSAGGYYAAKKHNRGCRRCAAKQSGFLDRFATSANAGTANAFFGKKHSDDYKARLSQDRKGKHFSERTEFRSESSKGIKNPMFGRTFYSVWLEKFGKDEADRRLAGLKARQSKRVKGSGNPMYGKPPPGGTGNGWKGWYRGHFFRSLRELSYMVQLDREKKEWRSAETNDLRIDYIDPVGSSRTYRADFFVAGYILVEVKPEKLKSSQTVRLKQEAAMKFCEGRGLEYQLIDVVKLTDEEIRKLHDTKEIVFTEKYEMLYSSC